MQWVRNYNANPEQNRSYRVALFLTLGGNLVLAVAKGIVACVSGAAAVYADAAAREAAWADNPGGKTWAAYQCYGDPGWTFRTGGGDAQTVQRPAGDEYATIASALGLALALEEAAVRARWSSAQTEDEGQAQRQAQLQKIRLLEARFAALWGGMGAVAEAYAVAYAEAGDFDAAIAWYERAVHADDSSASLKACEQFENLRARQAWQAVAQGQPTAAALASARECIEHAIERLQSLADRHATAARCSLIGSAWKRLAMLEQLAGNAAAARVALDAAALAGRPADAHRVEGAPADLPRAGGGGGRPRALAGDRGRLPLGPLGGLAAHPRSRQRCPRPARTPWRSHWAECRLASETCGRPAASD